MGILGQIIITIVVIVVSFSLIIMWHKKNKPKVLSDEERDEQKRRIYKALKEIIRSDSQSLIDELSERIEMREGDSPDGK